VKAGVGEDGLHGGNGLGKLTADDRFDGFAHAVSL
jgi:hypothetical protein